MKKLGKWRIWIYVSTDKIHRLLFGLPPMVPADTLRRNVG